MPKISSKNTKNLPTTLIQEPVFWIGLPIVSYAWIWMMFARGIIQGQSITTILIIIGLISFIPFFIAPWDRTRRLNIWITYTAMWFVFFVIVSCFMEDKFAALFIIAHFGLILFQLPSIALQSSIPQPDIAALFYMILYWCIFLGLPLFGFLKAKKTNKSTLIFLLIIFLGTVLLSLSGSLNAGSELVGL